MTTMTPQVCGDAAEAAIGAYLKQVGAYGDIEKVSKAMEMFISKAALALCTATNDVYTMDVLLRTAYNTAAWAESQGQGTVQ